MKKDRHHKLPSFLIIGMAKCGTTSLYEMLIQHPKIRSAITKELYFFEKDTEYSKGLHYYKRKFQPCAEDEICGEATPHYLRYHKTPKRVKDSLPNIKLIVLLRNPITRSYSHFYGYLRLCNQHEEKPITRNLEKFVKIIMKNPNIKLNYRGREFLEKSIYVTMLKRWYKYFSKEQIMIIKSEDFFENPCKVTDEIFEFLGLSPYDVKAKHCLKMEDLNMQSLKVQKYTELSKETINLLKNYYKPYNQQLYQLIGRDLEWEKY